MNYTPFGEFFRTLRIKNHEVLSDAAKWLGVTSAYISSVECGRRPMPDEWVSIITNHYSLKESEVEELRQHVDNSKTSVKINLISSTPMARTAALQFQRSFDSMDDDTAKKIMEIIERNKKSNGL